MRKGFFKPIKGLLKHTLTVGICVLIVTLGIIFLARSSPGTTTIGENINTGNLTASGTVSGENINTGDLTATGNISGAAISEAGTLLSEKYRTFSQPKKKITYFENLTAGDIVRIINDGEVNKAEKVKGFLPLVFEEANTMHISAVQLAVDKVLVAYQDKGNADRGTAIVLTTGITKGTAQVFESAETIYISAVQLTADKVLVAYTKTEGLDVDGRAVVLTTDDDWASFSAGTPKVFEEAQTSRISAVQLSSSKVLVAYCYKEGTLGEEEGRAVVLTTDDNWATISASTPVSFNEAKTTYISAVKLADGKALVAYRYDDSPGDKGRAVVLTTDDNWATISAGTPAAFSGTDTSHFSYISATLLTSSVTSSKVLVAFRDRSTFGSAVVLDISDSTVTPGNDNLFEAATIEYVSAVQLSSDKALIAYYYEEGLGEEKGKAVVLDINIENLTFTVGTPKVFEEATISYVSAAQLTADKVLVAYRDDGNNSYGTAVVLNISDTTVDVEDTKDEYIGIVLETKNTGDDGYIIFDGISDVHTELTPGTLYYVQANGTVGTTDTTYLIGRAISPTKILMYRYSP